MLMIFLACILVTVQGHGYLAEPPSRNLVRNWQRLDNCPTCHAGKFNWKKNPRYLDPNFNQFCGDDGNLANSVGVQRTYKAGEIAEFAVGIKVNHQGHYEFRICDRPVTGADKANPPAAQACFNKNLLLRATEKEIRAAYPNFAPCQINDPRIDCQPFDERHPERIYIPPVSSLTKQGDRGAWKNKEPGKRFQEMSEVHVMHFKIPTGLQCNECTLQWWWSSAMQSCLPDGDYLHYFGHTFKNAGWSNAGQWLSYWAHQSEIRNPNSPRRCRDSNLGEEWINCADVAVQGHAGPPPAPPPPPLSALRRRRSAPQPVLRRRRSSPVGVLRRRRSSRRRRRAASVSRRRRRRAASVSRRRRRRVASSLRRRRSRVSFARRRRSRFSMGKGDYEAALAKMNKTYSESLKAIEREEEQVFEALKKEETLENSPDLAGHLVLHQRYSESSS